MQKTVKMLAVILLVVTSLYSVALHWHSTIGLERGAEAIDKWESRLQPVREALPLQRGVIGFVGDWDVPGVDYSFADQETEFMLTQYALAPLILVKGPVADWNVAILSRDDLEIWMISNGEHFEVIPFKHNIYLLHRRAGP
jgi:hypothetical protein